MLHFIQKNSILILILNIISFSALASETKNPLNNIAQSDLPINITSKNLTVDQQKHLAIFKGNVIAIQGDTTIYSDQMDVIYQASEEEKSNNKKDAANSEAFGDIQTIITKGNVKIVTPEKHATSHYGIYDVSSANITLTGNVVLVQDKNVLKGDKFIHNLNNNKSEMISTNNKNNDRVKALFTPKKKPDSKKSDEK
jgi:lipopolysaccharide export system protein LptA